MLPPHSYADERIVYWLERHGYHPRSDTHGKALCEYFLDDLIFCSDLLSKAAHKGEVVYKMNSKVGEGSQLVWTVDLVLGPPTIMPVAISPNRRILEGEPRDIWLALDAKGVMTEHGKARRNRQRDLNSFASIMKHHYSNSVVGGLIVVNLADRFKSPLRPNITLHKNINKLVMTTVQLFREIPRAPKEGNGGIEAIGVIVVKHSNVKGDRTTLVTESPAPQKDDFVHYRKFLDLMKEALEHRHF